MSSIFLRKKSNSPHMADCYSFFIFITSFSDSTSHTVKSFCGQKLMTYYALGRWIVEEQQHGEYRAGYGKRVIRALSDRLNAEFGKGFSIDTWQRQYNSSLYERLAFSRPTASPQGSGT